MKAGSKYILSLGTGNVEKARCSNVDYYWLLPLSGDDPRIKYEEIDYIIQEINDSDVIEMSSGVEFINFIVKVPVYLYDIYKQQCRS